MAPIKFEEHIKDMLHKREIQPSARAWDKISSKLQTAPKQQKKGFFWYGMAAGFTGLFIISLFYFKSTSLPAVDNGAVETVAKRIEERRTDINSATEVLPMEGAIAIGETANQKVILPVTDLSVGDQKNSRNGGIADTPGVGPNLNGKREELWEGSEEVFNAKIVELLAQVDLLEKGNSTVTDSEVDSILRQAQREILRDRILRKGNSIDATALLMEVEDGLDKSFRDQIFETLKAGYLKVRTAVAERNN